MPDTISLAEKPITVTTDPRAESRAAAIAAFGWGHAEVRPLQADASFRRYFRLVTPAGTAMLMDAPPGREDVRPFIKVAEHLAGLGLSPPRILARDVPGGFLLLEDLGDDTFTRLLARNHDEATLYAMAVDTLLALHRHPQGAALSLPPYNVELLLTEARLLVEWYLPAMTGRPTDPALIASWDDAWRQVFAGLPAPANGLVLRDYHVDNLMVVAGRTGVAACGLLDFQDAVSGPLAYDLVSLLEDARRDIADPLAEAMLFRYATAMPGLDMASFRAWYRVLGVQRHAKVAGIFVRLCRRDGKPIYLKHIPRVMRLFARGLADPVLAPVARWVETHLPDPQAPLPEMNCAKL